MTVTIRGIGIAAAPRVVNQSLAGGDFSLSSGGSCTAGALYVLGQTCTANVAFTPQAPGLRQGGVILTDTSGNLLGEANVNGVGLGSLAVLDPGNISTVAGNGYWIYAGDGVAATAAPIFLPTGVVVDQAGNLYLSDSNNNRIRRVDAATGLITTVAGTGIAGFLGDGGPATQAMISNPSGLALDGVGNLYFADTGNQAVRRVDAVTGVITTVAGVPTVEGYEGDGGLSNLALLSFPQSVVLDSTGALYIADTGNDVVRRVNTNGFISTIAGTGTPGYNGDGQAATNAQLNSPWGLALGNDGSLYIADQNNNSVRHVTAGVIQTVAGTRDAGGGGNGGAATAAQLKAPLAITVDPAGNLYIADSGNNTVRKVYAADGTINTIVGDSSEQFIGDGGPANQAGLYGPNALALDSAGDLFVADMFHNRLRKISATQVSLKYPTIRVGKVSSPMAVLLASDGNAALSLTQIPLNNGALDVATTTCALNSPLAAGMDCNLGAEFAPTTVGSPVNGTITLDSNALTGSFGTAPVISLSGDVLSVNPTAVSLTSGLNPSTVGAAVTFSATVTGSSTLTGTVNFQDGSTVLCNIVMTSPTSTCTTSALTLGNHSITAVYSGDAEDAAATSAALIQVVKQQPVYALTVTPNPAVVGASVTMAVTVTAPTGTPTGTVAFYDGTTAIGSAALSSGAASITVSTLAVGTHSITVHYAGDATNAPGTSSAVSEVISARTTTTLLSTSNANVEVGTTVTFTATVGNGTAQTLTGTVQFNDGTTNLGSVNVNNSGIATLPVSTLTPGAHSITAVYSGDDNDQTSTSSALAETVNQIATTTTLASSSNPINAGATLQLTASVAATPGSNGGAVSGSVSFSDGAVTLGVVAVDANGHAVLNVNTLVPGTHSIVANYAGSTNYTASSSAALQQAVKQTSTSVSVTSAVNPTVVGQAVNLTITVSSATGVPTGSVSIKDEATSVGSAVLNASGVATFATSSLSVGVHSLTAVYSGDSSYTTATSTALQQTVTQGTSTITLAASTNPQVLGQSVTFTATVTSASPNLTGTVNFTDGATVLASVALNASGVVTYSTATLTAGQHIISAVYTGDTNHAASNQVSLTESIVQASSAVLLSSLNPAVSGNNVTFTTKISGAGTAIPTGTVTFKDGATVLGSATLDAAGSANVQTNALAVGSHGVSVSYPGDANYAASTASLTETIQNASTQIALTSSANPGTYGQPLSLSATVKSNGSVATGSVSFVVDGAALGSAVLDATGTATLITSALAPGTRSVVANYAGDGKAGQSSSVPLVLSVLQTTAVALTSSANPTQTLTSVTLTAIVSNNHVGVATGTVTFTDGPTLLGSAPLDGTGAAALSVAQLSAGSHSLVASYAGDGADFPSVSANLTERVNLRPTSTVVSGTPNDPTNPQSVLLIGVVNGGGSTSPSGTITFTEGSQTLGTVTVNATGVVTLPVILPTGTNNIVATYNGDSNYATSASQSTSISGGAVTQFSIQLSPASISMKSKQHGSTTVALASVAGFTDTMDFGCLGLPQAATCTFSKSSAMLAANGTMSVQLTVDTGNPLGASAVATDRRSGSSGVFLCLLPAALLLGIGIRKKKLASLLLCLFAIVFTLSATGCAGLQINGTPAGTYSFKVTASGQGTGVTESQTMTLTVTN